MTRGINGFVPERLLQVLAARRLSQVQLAAMVGVSPPTVSKWRSRGQAPEAETLVRLASVVNVSPEWFTRPVPPKLSVPMFRSAASAHVAAREMLEARLEWAQEIALRLSALADFPAVKLPSHEFLSLDQISETDIEAAALECRDLWRLGRGPIPDVALALESAGVILVREETGVAQIEGLSAWSEALQRPLVLLAADKANGFRSRVDAAHELGHLVLHKHTPPTTDRHQHNEMERQAHRFAGAFLLPAESFSAEIRTPVTLDSLLLLKQRWGVSVAAMIMRLAALGIVDEDEKMALFKRRSARWGAKSEPGDGARAPEKPRLLKRTIELLVSSNVMPLEGVTQDIGLSSQDIVMLAGLPERYFEGPAEVVDLAKLRPRGEQASVPQSGGTSGSVLPFVRR
jgi:Zn-dependent peptidase ImmA (M78 family)/DNA-binding transcriptional regulator YdaS (Cro superfamily)